MAVPTSGDTPPSEEELDPQYVAAAFVEQYYLHLENSPELVYKFYTDESMIDRPRPDDEMESIMTAQAINDEIMSSDYKGCSFEVINFDAQASLMGGVLVAVNGELIGKDNLKKSFMQTFFLAKQPKGYFVLNDILRFLGVIESQNLPSSNGTMENACSVAFTDDQETPAQPKEVTDAGEKVSGVGSGEKASDVKSGNKLLDTETCKKLPGIKTGEKASNVDSRENASDMDIGKKPVSHIKDAMAEAYNCPLKRSENESTLTHVASNEKQETKKTSYASVVAKEVKVTSPTNNTGYKIVRVAPTADQQSIARATPIDPVKMANGAKKELIANNLVAGKNNARSNALAPKSIYIGNLPWNITKHRLVDALKIFGHVRPGGVQIKICEDGFSYGFVEFESASSASKAVQVHNVTVGGHIAYMMYKKSSRSGNNGGNGGSRSGNSKRQDAKEVHGNGSYRDDNQADIKNQPQGTSGQSMQPADESSRAGEAYKKSRHRRGRRRKSGDASQKKNNKLQ